MPIPVSKTEFFADIEDASESQLLYSPEEFIEVAPQFGEVSVSLGQLGNASSHTLQLLNETYLPKTDTGPELLSHIGEEAGIVIEGHIEITLGDRVKVLGPAEGYPFDSRQPNCFRNIGTEVCKIISACSPPTF